MGIANNLLSGIVLSLGHTRVWPTGNTVPLNKSEEWGGWGLIFEQGLWHTWHKYALLTLHGGVIIDLLACRRAATQHDQDHAQG